MWWVSILSSALAAMALVGGAAAQNYRAAAQSLDTIISHNYAYADKLPGGILPQSKQLSHERDIATNRNALLRYAEDRLASLADHHAITGSSLKNSWAVIPTYTDLWIVRRNGEFVIDAVRDDSPAAAAGIKQGDRLASIGGVDLSVAVPAFWNSLGLTVTPQRADYAARVLAAGRRDRDRSLGIETASGSVREIALPSLYKNERARPPLSLSARDGRWTIRVNNSLGEDGIIAALDRMLARVPPNAELMLDLRDTPSGGNTTVARAIMGWFVDGARGYQIHNRPEEERTTGIARQWIEQVLPRVEKHRDRLPTVLVGRWTGSMGEGLAIGFAALGASVRGGPMAGLNGSVEDFTLGDTNVVVKLPTERLMTVSGQPREDFQPER